MAESATESTAVPVKVPAPEGNAPPTLAEPASGPVAEVSSIAHPSEKSAESHTSVTDSASAAQASATTNGAEKSAAEQPAETSEKPNTETADSTKDTEMEDAPPASAVTTTDDGAATGKNGVAGDKRAGNGKRKSVGGVPEHKSKKLNKKKSMQKITHLDAKPGDYYIARLKSFPPWPSIICDEDMLPTSLLSTRPVTTKKADGTYNEPYVDDGKKVADRTFPIMFLSTNEFAWIPNTDLAPLDPADCKDVPIKSKSKQLLSAYEVASENHELQYFKDMLRDHARALQEDEEAREAKAAEKAEKAAKSDKKKRKSEVKATEEDVTMADADAEPSTTKKASKKRKKDAESDDEETEKPAKTPKTTKLKLTTKTPTTEKKAKEPKSAKPKSEKKAKKVSSDEEPEAQKEEEAPLDPVEARKAREKEVLFLRHKLQKGFLDRHQAPREEEMPQMSNYIKKLEAYSDLEVAIIRATKINKVLKGLLKLNTIPRDEEFQFRKRSVELLGKWTSILGTETEPAENSTTPATNGVHEEKETTDDNVEDVKTADVKEPKENTLAPAEAIEKVSAEVPATADAKAPVIESLEKEKEPAKESEAGSTEGDKTQKDATAPAEPERVPESAEAAHAVQEVVKASE